MSKRRILVVEDNTSMRTMLKETLEQGGYEVTEADNGEDALNFVKENDPHLILLDIILPKKDGFEVIKDIRSWEAAKQTPIVLLTNLESTEDIEKALSLGATSYLVKSNYSLEEIVKKVGTMLQ